jgi:UDP-2-acetamido-3-amino-2,3-dideoxy-glucuronate N-acetyltransferase
VADECSTTGSQLVSQGMTEDSLSTRPGVHIANTADVHPSAEIGEGSAVWHGATIREHARLGRECVIGRGAYIDDGVILGDRVKVQNLALVYAPAVLENDVFIGPAVVLTNDRYPRSVSPEGNLKRADDWLAEGVIVREGAAIGARVVVVAGLRIGRYALVAAGAVVSRNIPDFALVRGLPARHAGWVGRAGVPLIRDGSGWRCPRTSEFYVEDDYGLRPA